MLRTRCPHCQVPLGLPDNLAGKRIQCQSCHQAFVVGATPDETPAPPPWVAPRKTETPPVSRKEQTSSRPLELDEPEVVTSGWSEPVSSRPPAPEEVELEAPATRSDPQPRAKQVNEEDVPHPLRDEAADEPSSNRKMLLFGLIGGGLTLVAALIVILVIVLGTGDGDKSDGQIAQDGQKADVDRQPLENGFKNNKTDRKNPDEAAPKPKDPPDDPGDKDPPNDLRPMVPGQTIKPLPSTVSDVCVGGGGQYLVLHLPQERKLAVFDVPQAKIAGFVPVAEDGARFAAGQHKLFVALPAKNILERWSLTTLEREMAAPLPFAGKVAALCIGSAASGPLLVGIASDAKMNTCGTRLVDTTTLKEISFDSDENVNFTASLVRASADGQTFGMHDGFGAEPHTMRVMHVQGRKLVVHSVWGDTSGSLALPSPDGKYVYMAGGVFDEHYKPLGKTTRRSGKPYIPAHQGELYLQLDPTAEKPGSVSVFLPGNPAALARLPDVEGVSAEQISSGSPRDVLTHDKRVHFFPDHNVVVSIPSTNDRLVLRSFDVDEAIEKSGIDYLLVKSRPPAEVHKGNPMTYQVAVKSKKGDVTYRLQSGPPGMVISQDGQVVWNVPKDFADAEAKVNIIVADASGQEVVHAFKLAVRAGGVPAPTPVPAPEKSIVKLPGPAAKVTLGGNGRYLIVVMPTVRQLAVIDVADGKIATTIAIVEDNIGVAAGQDKIVVLDPAKSLLTRYSLPGGMKEATAPAPIKGNLKDIAMGWATQGPLLVTYDDPSAKGPLLGTFLNPKTFKPLAVGTGTSIRLGMGPLHLRMAANGSLVTMWSTELNTGPQTLVRETKEWKTYTGSENVAFALPSADGRIVFTSRGPHSSQLKVLGNAPVSNRVLLPSAHGSYYLSIPASRVPIKVAKGFEEVTVHLQGTDQPFARLPQAALLENVSIFERPGGLEIDQRVFFIPDAKTIAVFPDARDQLVLHKFDVLEALERSGIDYLVVTSQPPGVVARGKRLTYQVQVKSKKGGVEYKLDSGSRGMEISKAGLVTWDVPSDYNLASTPVSIGVSDASGQLVPHAFRLTLGTAADLEKSEK